LHYSEKSLEESLHKWHQIEICECELRFAEGKKGQLMEITKFCNETTRAFESAMETDLNTPLGLGLFLRLVAELNHYAANEELTADMSRIARPTFDNIMKVLGLKMLETTRTEKQKIESLISMRNELRVQKKFQESDLIRKRLTDEYSVELFDHKTRTVWTKVERPSYPKNVG
jgi:cysteinyl-tRNA synthetase